MFRAVLVNAYPALSLAARTTMTMTTSKVTPTKRPPIVILPFLFAFKKQQPERRLFEVAKEASEEPMSL
jgi:TolB-like protein